jgi:hypothetical protein
MTSAVRAPHHARACAAVALAAHEGRTVPTRRTDRLRQSQSAGDCSRDSNGADYQGSLLHACLSNPIRPEQRGPSSHWEGEISLKFFRHQLICDKVCQERAR